MDKYTINLWKSPIYLILKDHLSGSRCPFFLSFAVPIFSGEEVILLGLLSTEPSALCWRVVIKLPKSLTSHSRFLSVCSCSQCTKHSARLGPRQSCIHVTQEGRKWNSERPKEQRTKQQKAIEHYMIYMRKQERCGSCPHFSPPPSALMRGACSSCVAWSEPCSSGRQPAQPQELWPWENPMGRRSSTPDKGWLEKRLNYQQSHHKNSL